MIKLLCQSAACVLVAATMGGCSFLQIVGSALETEKTEIAPPAVGTNADGDSAGGYAMRAATKRGGEATEVDYFSETPLGIGLLWGGVLVSGGVLSEMLAVVSAQLGM